MLLLLLLFLGLAASQDCPSTTKECHCEDKSENEVAIMFYCDNMSYQYQIPPLKTGPSPIYVEQFYIRNSTVDRIQQDAFDNTGIRILKLPSIGLRSLDPDAFTGVIQTTLEQIYLQNNSICSIPKQVFFGLRDLTYINLGHNFCLQFNNEHKDLFVNLREVRELHLEHNDVSVFPPSILRDMTDLETLMIHNNRISQITHEHFNRTRDLKKIDLSHNEISTIPENAFKELADLEFLNISHNRIRELPENVFANQVGLVHLNLSGNELYSLPSDLFKSSPAMLTLDLSNNDLQSIYQNTFSGFREAQVISLHGNRISSLDSTLFEGLASLKMIDISDNEITMLPTGLFYDNRAVEKLRIGGNRLTGLSKDVFRVGSSSITELDLSHNRLMMKDVDLTHMTNIRMLNLSGNEIMSIPGNQFSLHENIRNLDLSMNRLTEILPAYFYDIASLDVLNISHNNIEDIKDRAFERNSNLDTLILSYNDLRTLSVDMFYGTQLKILCLDHNNLTAIPNNVFARISLLEVLHLQGNLLTSLSSESLTPLQNLIELDLSSNMMSSIPSQTFKPLKSLEKLCMADNVLSSVSDSSFSELTSLKELDLKYNHLKTMKKSIISRQTLKALNLGYNPLVCSCDIIWMRESSFMMDHNETVCHITEKNKDDEYHYVMCNPVKCTGDFNFVVGNTDDLCYQTVPWVFTSLPPDGKETTSRPGSGDGKEPVTSIDDATKNTLIIVGVLLAVVILGAIIAIWVMSKRKKKSQQNVLVTNGSNTMTSRRAQNAEHVNAGATLDAYKIPAGGRGSASNTLQWRQSSAAEGMPEARAIDGQLNASEEHSWSYETTAEPL